VINFNGAGSMPTRIFGPCKSWSNAKGRLSRFDTARRMEIRSAWESWVPWEKFKRATSIPASINFSINSSPWLAGPIVATILAFLSMQVFNGTEQ
jgi:hypothetical protein